MNETFNQIDEMGAQGLANFVHSFASLEIKPSNEKWEIINKNIL